MKYRKPTAARPDPAPTTAAMANGPDRDPHSHAPARGRRLADGRAADAPVTELMILRRAPTGPAASGGGDGSIPARRPALLGSPRHQAERSDGPVTLADRLDERRQCLRRRGKLVGWNFQLAEYAA